MTSARTVPTNRHANGDLDDRGALARRLTMVVGIVFLAVGILGFIPGVTTHYGEMEAAGHESEAQLLGLFNVSVLHNLVHLAFGVAGLALARKASTAITYLLAGGVVYLVLAAYGFLIDHESDANFVPVDRADDWLHLGLAVGMIGLGVLARSALRDDRAPAR